MTSCAPDTSESGDGSNDGDDSTPHPFFHRHLPEAVVDDDDNNDEDAAAAVNWYQSLLDLQRGEGRPGKAHSFI